MTKEQIMAMVEMAKRELSKGENWMRISPEVALEIFALALEGIGAPPQGRTLRIVPHTPDIQK